MMELTEKTFAKKTLYLFLALTFKISFLNEHIMEKQNSIL